MRRNVAFRVLSGAEVGREQARIDAGALEGRGPARIDVAIVEQGLAARGGEPAVAAQFPLELAGAPAGIAQGGEPAARTPPLGDRAEDLERCAERPAVADLDALGPAPFSRVEEEAALRLDRPAEMDRNVGRDPGIDVELLEQIVEGDARHDPAEADAECAILVM